MRERTKEYRKELEEMQLRVKNRPYLFEQVSKVTGQSSKCLWVTGYIVFDLGQALRNHLKSFTVRKVLMLVESVDYTWDSHTDVMKIPFHDLKNTGTYLIIELSNP